MRWSIIFVLVMMLACQSEKKNTDKAESTLENKEEITENTEPVSSISDRNTPEEIVECSADVCLQLRNHDASKKSFDIYMANSVNVFGFQCDLFGIEISDADGGLLKENEYQTSNSASRLLSFSLQARPIPIGMGVLTKIHYNNPANEVCMTEIVFAGIGGAKLSNNEPECLKLN